MIRNTAQNGCETLCQYRSNLPLFHEPAASKIRPDLPLPLLTAVRPFHGYCTLTMSALGFWLEPDEELPLQSSPRYAFPAPMQPTRVAVSNVQPIQQPRVILAMNGKIEEEIPIHSPASKPCRRCSLAHFPVRPIDRERMSFSGKALPTSPTVEAREQRIAMATAAYDHAFDIFTRLYQAIIPRITRYGYSKSSKADLDTLRLSYSGLIQAFIRLCHIERDVWDSKSWCLGMDEMFEALRHLFGTQSEYAQSYYWTPDLDVEVPDLRRYLRDVEGGDRTVRRGDAVRISSRDRMPAARQDRQTVRRQSEMTSVDTGGTTTPVDIETDSSDHNHDAVPEMFGSWMTESGADPLTPAAGATPEASARVANVSADRSRERASTSGRGRSRVKRPAAGREASTSRGRPKRRLG